MFAEWGQKEDRGGQPNKKSERILLDYLFKRFLKNETAGSCMIMIFLTKLWLGGSVREAPTNS